MILVEAPAAYQGAPPSRQLYRRPADELEESDRANQEAAGARVIFWSRTLSSKVYQRCNLSLWTFGGCAARLVWSSTVFLGMIMGPLTTSVIALACVFSGALVGMFFRSRVPDQYLGTDSIPLTDLLAITLRDWQKETVYGRPSDWVFASTRCKGKKPRSASVLAFDHLRPAALAAGVKIKPGQRFGFHNFRHGLASWLVNKGTDVKTVQSLLRHSNVKTTLGLYTHRVNESMLVAQESVMRAMTVCETVQ